ncbi:integrase [Gossypium australe]|uniref:Integrase n=1 Tax=Gossypium australe TaxID=47621 RepID=A0A5B6WSQ1_9ROSI|nr:integrase [Gossypium australe]
MRYKSLCQNGEHQVLLGLVQPILIAEWKWEHVTMDFVSGLPLTPKKKDSIWVLRQVTESSGHETELQYSSPSSN